MDFPSALKFSTIVIGFFLKTKNLIYKLYILVYIRIYDKMTYINKKDLIRINQEIGESGNFHNENTLDFALSIIKQKKSWLFELSYLVRSLLVDHVFRDGNKRTALILLTTYLEDRKLEYDKDRIIKVFWNISKKNVTDINKIMRLIKSIIIY